MGKNPLIFLKSGQKDGRLGKSDRFFRRFVRAEALIHYLCVPFKALSLFISQIHFHANTPILCKDHGAYSG